MKSNNLVTFTITDKECEISFSNTFRFRFDKKVLVKSHGRIF